MNCTATPWDPSSPSDSAQANEANCLDQNCPKISVDSRNVLKTIQKEAQRKISKHVQITTFNPIPKTKIYMEVCHSLLQKTLKLDGSL